MNFGGPGNSSEKSKHVLLEFSSAFHIVCSVRYLVWMFLRRVDNQSIVKRFEPGEVYTDTGSTTRKDRVVPYFSQTLLDRHCMGSVFCFRDLGVSDQVFIPKVLCEAEVSFTSRVLPTCIGVTTPTLTKYKLETLLVVYMVRLIRLGLQISDGSRIFEMTGLRNCHQSLNLS